MRKTILLFVFFAAFAADPARAARSKLCLDYLLPQDDVNRIASIRGRLESDAEFRRTRREAADAIEKALKTANEGADLPTGVKASVEDVRVLVDNPLFDEALARAMKFAGLKEESAIRAFQARLKIVSEAERIAFGEAVIRQYRIVIEDAFKWVDADRFDEVLKRWGLNENQAFALLERWQMMELTDFAELKLAVGVWSRTVSADSIAEAVHAVRKTRGGHLDDAEEVLFTRIRKDFTDEDLALNDGPISQAAFDKRMRYLNVVAWFRRRLTALRNPKESVFLMFITGGPLVAIAAVIKTPTAVLSVVGAATALVSLAPTIEHLTRHVVSRARDPVILKIYSIGQLNELRRWMTRNPLKSKEVGFDSEKLLGAIDARIKELQKIRYERPRAPTVQPR